MKDEQNIAILAYQYDQLTPREDVSRLVDVEMVILLKEVVFKSVLRERRREGEGAGTW